MSVRASGPTIRGMDGSACAAAEDNPARLRRHTADTSKARHGKMPAFRAEERSSMNIAMLLQMAAEACPDRRALTSGGRHYTYAELYRGARAAAERIRASGCAYASVLD